jgi:hypothetical protein
MPTLSHSGVAVVSAGYGRNLGSIFKRIGMRSDTGTLLPQLGGAPLLVGT